MPRNDDSNRFSNRGGSERRSGYDYQRGGSGENRLRGSYETNHERGVRQSYRTDYEDRAYQDETGSYEKPSFGHSDRLGATYGRPANNSEYGVYGANSGENYGANPSYRTESNRNLERMNTNQRDNARVDYRGRGPRNYRRSDERIREDINDSLTEHDEIDATDIEVDVQNGDVILSGWVFDYYSKRTAEYLAEDVRGVVNVENRLRIRKPTETTPGTFGSIEDLAANYSQHVYENPAIAMREEAEKTDSGANDENFNPENKTNTANA